MMTDPTVPQSPDDRDEEDSAARIIDHIEFMSALMSVRCYATIRNMAHIPDAKCVEYALSLRADLDDLFRAHAVKWVGDMGGRL